MVIDGPVKNKYKVKIAKRLQRDEEFLLYACNLCYVLSTYDHHYIDLIHSVYTFLFRCVQFCKVVVYEYCHFIFFISFYIN